jgi:hypothetical protein
MCCLQVQGNAISSNGHLKCALPGDRKKNGGRTIQNQKGDYLSERVRQNEAGSHKNV